MAIPVLAAAVSAAGVSNLSLLRPEAVASSLSDSAQEAARAIARQDLEKTWGEWLTELLRRLICEPLAR